ncbi:hypothetical protein KIL84_006166 [Mauremys mutica]|uniref:Uncharacterized protein n=1 Tax=Mauremys mutica TaxID=74926 RepID=A0A9D4ATT2_9SAUR|nr:hypothetical protein KIL84_006166 [Mauremys mutica]
MVGLCQNPFPNVMKLPSFNFFPPLHYTAPNSSLIYYHLNQQSYTRDVLSSLALQTTPRFDILKAHLQTVSPLSSFSAMFPLRSEHTRGGGGGRGCLQAKESEENKLSSLDQQSQLMNPSTQKPTG